MTTIPTAATADLAVLHEVLATLGHSEDQAASVTLLQHLESLSGAVEATKARVTARFETLRLEQEAANGIPKEQRGKGLGAEVGLARSESPARGFQHLELARSLCQELVHTMEALTAGRIREEQAQAVYKEVAWLSPKNRQAVDHALRDRLGTLGPRKLAAEARAHAQRLDAAGSAKRSREARKQRRITMRPAAHGMAELIAHGPAQQIAAMFNVLRKDAGSAQSTGKSQDEDGQPRSRDEITFDLLVERVTGQATAAAVPAEVLLVMTPDTLFAQDDTPAWLIGHGPIPASVARHWLADAQAAIMLRRLFTDAQCHNIVNMESRARRFLSGLRKMILVRDGICRNLFCEAPIQEFDHIDKHSSGGKTAWNNASGLCAACNQTKENRGWKHEGDAQTLRITTPTGHPYLVPTAPLLPGRPPADTTLQRRRSGGKKQRSVPDDPDDLTAAHGSAF